MHWMSLKFAPETYYPKIIYSILAARAYGRSGAPPTSQVETMKISRTIVTTTVFMAEW